MESASINGKCRKQHLLTANNSQFHAFYIFTRKIILTEQVPEDIQALSSLWYKVPYNSSPPFSCLQVSCIRYWTKIPRVQCSGRSENGKKNFSGLHFFPLVRSAMEMAMQFTGTSALTLSLLQEVVVGPENRAATSNDNFLRVNLIGDFAGYTNIPSFEDFYLVIPRQVYSGSR